MIITNAGTGRGLHINQNGSGYALYVDNSNQGSRFISTAVIASARDNVLIYSNEEETLGESNFRVITENALSTIPCVAIKNDGTGAGLNIDQNGAGVALAIQQDAATAHRMVNFQQNGDAEALYIDQNGEGRGIIIDSEALLGDSYGISINMLDSGEGARGFYVSRGANDFTILTNNNNNTNGSNHIYRNKTSVTTAGPVLKIEQDNTADDQTVVFVQQDSDTGIGMEIQNAGAGYGLFIDQNGDGMGMFIDSEATSTNNYALNVIASQGAKVARLSESANNYFEKRTYSDPTGSNLFYRNVTAASTAAPVVTILQNEATDDQPALKVQQEGTGIGIHIDQDGDGNALRIDSVGQEEAININWTNALDLAGWGVVSITATPTGPMGSSSALYIDVNNNQGMEGINLRNDGDGTGISIDQNGNGKSIYIDTTSEIVGIQLYRHDVTPTSELFRLQEPATSSQNVIHITNEGTGAGIYVDQNGNGNSLVIDSEATTNTVFNLTATNTDANIVSFVNYGNHADAGNDVLLVYQENSSSVGRAMRVVNNGTGNGLFIDQNGNGIGLNIDSESDTLAAMIVDHRPTVACSDSSVWITSKNDATAPGQGYTGNSLGVNQLDAGRTATFIKGGTANTAVSIDQNTNGMALNIATSNTNPAYYGMEIINQPTGRGIYVGNSGSNVTLVREDTSGTSSNWFYRNISSATTAGPVMLIEQDAATDDQNALNIQQDGTGVGLWVNQNGNGYGLYVDSEATSGGTYGLLVETGLGANCARFTMSSDRFSILALDDTQTVGANWFYRNELTAVSQDAPVVRIEQDNAGDAGVALYVQQDGTGRAIYATDDIETTGQIYADRGVFNNGGTNNALALTSTDAGVNITMEDDTTTAAIALHRDANDLLIVKDGGTAIIGPGGSTGPAPINVVPQTGDPASPNEGDMWYNSTSKQFKGYNGTSVVILG